MRNFALVPAAGESRRMGRPKLSLPLGNRSVLEHVLAALVEQHFDAILVVIGPSARHLEALVRPPAIPFLLKKPTHDMRATLERGIEQLEKVHRPEPEDAVVVALGDQPTIQASIVARLLALHAKDPHDIRIPAYGSKRGHPVLIPFEILSKLPEIPPGQGLNGLISRYPSHVCELETTTSDVLVDMDEPADYRKLAPRDWK